MPVQGVKNAYKLEVPKRRLAECAGPVARDLSGWNLDGLDGFEQTATTKFDTAASPCLNAGARHIYAVHWKPR